MDRKKLNSQLPLEAFCDGISLSPKVLSMKRRFRLKRTESQSLTAESEDSDNSTQLPESVSSATCSSEFSETLKDSSSPLDNKNDSLINFKSPKQEPELKVIVNDFKAVNFKKKLLSIKSKPASHRASKTNTSKERKPSISKEHKRSTSEENKPGTSKQSCDRKTISDPNQMSIESSFFKPRNEVKTAFMCPLCFKSYKDATAQNTHMKSCATKNNVSTRKLFDAMELQERQARERKAMGLLTAPILQPKKTVSRKMISDKDPHLQLALALSMSLHEAQQTEELEETEILAGEPILPMRAETLDEREKTLQNFGFTTNKPIIAPTSTGSRKKRLMGPTILQTRSQEERDRLVTERIAEVLMGDEAITQAMQKDAENVTKHRKKIIIKSNLLQNCQCVEDRLWDKSKLTPSRNNFYVSSLSMMISPCKVKPKDETQKLPQESDSPVLQNQVRNVRPDKFGDKNSTPKKLESAPTISDDKRKRDAEIMQCPSTSSRTEIDKRNKPDINENSAKMLIMDWRSMVGTSYCSDILVFVKDDLEIYAHQLVLCVRCYEIVGDIVPNNNKGKHKKKICWPEVDYSSAIAFLQFIYCGVIDLEDNIFNDASVLTGIRSLARKYRVKELFAYLRDRQKEWDLKKHELDKSSNSEIEDRSGNINDTASSSGQSKKRLIVDQNPKLHTSSQKNNPGFTQRNSYRNPSQNSRSEICKEAYEQVRNSNSVKVSNMSKSTDKELGNEHNTSQDRLSQSLGNAETKNTSSNLIQRNQVASYNENSRNVKITVTMEIPSDVINETTECNKTVGPEMPKKLCTDDITALIDATNIRESIENLLTSTRINCDRNSNNSKRESITNISERHNHLNNSRISRTENKELTKTSNQILVNEFIEKERSISPDIFSDSSEENPIAQRETPVESDEDGDQTTEQGSRNLEMLLSLVNKESQFETIETENKVSFFRPRKEIIGTNSDTPDGISFIKPCEVVNDFANITTRRKKKTSCAPEASSVDGLDEDTGKKSDVTRRQIDSNIAKAKQNSNITLAIEKIQRLNAKTASDSDSDLESPLTFPMKKRRNPFNVDQDDSSCFFEKNPKSALHSYSYDEVSPKKRNALSIFEQEIEKEAVKNPAAFNLTSYKSVERKDSTHSRLTSNILTSSGSDDVFQKSKLDQPQNYISDVIDLSQDSPEPSEDVDEVFDLTQTCSDDSNNKIEMNSEVETDEQHMSMYARYKRKNRHNSINRYRTGLRNAMRMSGDSDTELPAVEFKKTNNNMVLSDTADDTETDNAMPMKVDKLTSKNIHTDTVGNFFEASCSKIVDNDDPTSSKEGIKYNDTNNVELSDLEIDMSSCSTIVLSENITSGIDMTKKIQSSSTTKNLPHSPDIEEPLADTITEAGDLKDIEFSDSEFTIVKTKEKFSRPIEDKKKVDIPNLSSEETDTDCYVTAVSRPRQSKKFCRSRVNIEWSDKQMSNIYDEETDAEDGLENLKDPVNIETSGGSKKPASFGEKIQNLDNCLRTKSISPRKSQGSIQIENEKCSESKLTNNTNPCRQYNSPEESIPQCSTNENLQFCNLSLKSISDVTDTIDNILEECKSTDTQRLSDSSVTKGSHDHETSNLNSILLDSSPELRLDEFGYISYGGDCDMGFSPARFIESDDEINSCAASNGNDANVNKCNTSHLSIQTSSRTKSEGIPQKAACKRKNTGVLDKLAERSVNSAKNNIVARVRSRSGRPVHEISLSPQSSPQKNVSEHSRNTTYSAGNMENTKRCSENIKSMSSSTGHSSSTKTSNHSKDTSCFENNLEKAKRPSGKGKSTSLSKSTNQGTCSQEPKPKSTIRSLKIKSASESVLSISPIEKVNTFDDSMDNNLLRLDGTPPFNRNVINKEQITPQQETSSNNVTPLANYSIMPTPQLKKELQKYGLKAQKRERAKKLLRHIYNELHPLVPVGEKLQSNSETLSSGDEGPLPKKMNRTKSLETLNMKHRLEDDSASDCEKSASQNSTMSNSSDGSILADDLYSDESDSLNQVQNSTSPEEAFRRLLEIDKELHNKVLTYEPLRLEEIHATLKARGFKCKLKALVAFLDKQCITFRTQVQATRNRNRRKRGLKNIQATEAISKQRKK